MSLVQESLVQALLGECDQLSQRQQRQAKEAVVHKLDQIYDLFRKNIRDAFLSYSLDVIIRFAEVAVEIPARFSRAAEIVGLFFERVQTTNQFYIRALLVKAKVVAYTAHSNNQKGEDMLASLREAISFVARALDLISPQTEPAAKGGKDPKGAAGGDTGNKAKYAFLIYNASTTLYKVTRFMLRGGWQRSFVDVYERIFRLLEEVDEADHNWRCRFAMILYQCLYDAQRKPDAYKVLDTLWQKTKNKPCEFQDSLFRLRVYLCKENNALAAVIKKDIEGADPNGWKVLQALQRMRSGLVPEPQVEKQLMTIVNQISLGVLSTSQNTNSTQLSAIMQERLAEAGRIALRFNLTNLASSIVSFLGKTRQPSQKALVLNQYNKAELLVKKKGDYVDKKTGMSMNAQQIKEVEIENRIEALKVMEKVMIINKKLDNAELIYEGAVLVWNIALPFLSEQYHTYAAKALDLALLLLEQIDSNDHQLRTKFHLQLTNIYFDNDLMFAEVESNVFKALRLDPSIPPSRLQIKPEAEEDPSLYARPYHRYLHDFRQKVLLKNMQVQSPTPLDVVTQDLWTIYDHKSETTKIDTLQKCLKVLIAYEEPAFKVDPQQLLVEEEIKKKKLDYQREKLRAYKRRKLLVSEIARLSFEWDLNDFAKKAAELVLADNWDVKNAVEMIIAQGHACLYLAQIKIDQLYQQNLQPLLEQESQGAQGKEKKAEVTAFLKRSLEFALTAQQSYLIFNGAVCLWNNFIHIFRVTANDTRLRPDLAGLLKDYFQAMRNALREIQTKGVVNYDLDDKIQIFSNIGLIYARLMESQKQTALVEKVCEDLLLTNLSPNTRKLINAIKARVAGGKAAGAKPADAKKGGAPPPVKAPGFNDGFILQISNQLELIQNSPNRADCESQIVKCFDGLEGWKPNEQDESQLELHAELWVKLARLASNEENSKMLKYALRCSEKALAQSKVGDPATIPSNRLRWYSLAEFLSSETLLKLVNPKTQQAASVEGLLLLSLARGVEAASKGFKCGINILVLDAGKQVWNVSAKLQESKANRAKLIQPIRTVLSFLRELKEDGEPDLLLLLSQLYFRAAWESSLFRQGQQLADMMLELLPKGLQKSLWQAKMAFMSKQGKNELQAISSIKQAEPSLQAKLWVKLARIAPNPQKQHAAYNKALQILKKEHSVEIVEVLIEYSEWQLRVGKEPVDTVVKNLQYASNVLTEIQMDAEDDDQGEPDEENQTINSHSKSRSLRSKKSHASKSIKSSQKDIKSKADKKPTISNRSKASAVSRMNRSGRGAKSVKNKNTKSVFSVKEEEPNPQSLNCLHFERLFRIYTILASIHSQRGKRMVLALKASRFAVKMIEKSINTFNELQQNAAKLNEKDEKVTYKTIIMPESIQQWVAYQLPKDYIDKVSKVDNMNFLGTYALEKPELTYTYINKLAELLSSLGLDYQTVPLRFLAKYLTKHILRNQQYYQLQELKIKRILMLNRHPLESSVKVEFQAIKISEQEIKEEQLKAEYQKVSLTDTTSSFDAVSAPNLVQPLSKSACWFEFGRVLVDFGEVTLAKTHLREALECAKILGNNEQIGRIHVHLCEIAFLQGQPQQAVQHLLLAHRLCKSSFYWQHIIALAQRTLISIRKHDVLAGLLGKVRLTVSELIEENSKEGKQRAGFRTELHQLKQLLIAADLAYLYLRFKQVLQENTSDNRNAFGRALQGFEKAVEDKGIAWNVLNYQLFLSDFQQIVELYEHRGGNDLISLGSENFTRIFNILGHLERNLKDFIKGVNLNDDDGGNYNSIVEIQVKLGLLRVAALCQQHKLTVSEDTLEEVEGNGEAGNQKIELFMKTLDREIKVRAEPVSVKLGHLQMALTLLNDLQAHISEGSVFYPRLLALYAYVQTLKDHSSSQALQAADSFRTRAEERLQRYETDPQSHTYQLKALESISQQQMEHLPNEYFEYLAKAQHAASVLSAFRFLSRKLSPNHKFVASQRLLTTVKNKDLQQLLIQKEKLFSSLIKFPSYQDGVKLMPKNSIYVILRLSSCKTKLFTAAMINEPETANKKILARQKSLTATDLTRIKGLTDSLVNCRKVLIKTPIDDENKLKVLLDQNEAKLKQVKTQLQSWNHWWLAEVLEYLKTPKSVPQPVGGDKDKKGGKDVKKKGGKDEVAGYQSPLPPSPSGIESVVFLLDEFLYSLPFEQLIPTGLVPAVSKDSSFFWLSRKLHQVSFQPDLNNSAGFGADKGKYFGYDFKVPERNFKTLAAQLSKGPQALKQEGIDSSTRLPSLGDFSKNMGEPGWLSVYGSVDLLNLVRFSTFAEQAGSNKFRLLVVNDNINLSKSTLNKFKDLGTESLTINVEESEKAYSIVANLLNATLVKNRWFMQWSQLEGNVKAIYKALASGHYVGASNRQNRGESISSQWYSYVHGPSVIRL